MAPPAPAAPLRHGRRLRRGADRFLICGHLWGYQSGEWPGPWLRWTSRAQALIPPGLEATRFSASRVFTAAYPEAVALACVIASPAWRTLAAGDTAQQQRLISRIGRQLGRPGYRPGDIFRLAGDLGCVAE
ncbi:MAG: hypothetical protein M0030_22780 [Actinomycetota bacterium]|jgi:hypothetical protein|nr:hypothetical protein [Actinomycetota bacterium]